MSLRVKKEDGMLQHNWHESFTRFTLLNSSYAIFLLVFCFTKYTQAVTKCRRIFLGLFVVNLVIQSDGSWGNLVRTEDDGIPLFASHDHPKDQTKNGQERIACKHTVRRLTGPKGLLLMMIMLLLQLMMRMINYTYYI